MKEYAVVCPERGSVALQEITVGDPGENEIQVRVHASLISPGTERAWILGMPNTPCRFPFEPGYCVAGIVEKVGSGVTTFAEGDRAACFMISHRTLGNIGAEWAVKIPDGVPCDHAVFMPLGEIAMQGVRKAGIGIGEKVMVLGLGIIGQLALQLARINGALPAVGVDRLDKRLKTALECGADQAVNPEDKEWLEQLGSKPQVVIESTGNADVLQTAFKSAGNFGRVILLGSTRGDSTINFYKDVHCTGITIVGAHAGHAIPKFESRPGYWTWKDETDCFMRLIKAGRLCLGPLITGRVKPDAAEEVYKEIIAGNPDMIGTVIQWC